jgi:hypothetical protein
MYNFPDIISLVITKTAISKDTPLSYVLSPKGEDIEKSSPPLRGEKKGRVI